MQYENGRRRSIAATARSRNRINRVAACRISTRSRLWNAPDHAFVGFLFSVVPGCLLLGGGISMLFEKAFLVRLP